MQADRIAISIFTEIFAVLITRRFMRLFFELKEENVRKEKIAYILFFLADIIVFQIFHSLPLNMIVSIGSFFLISTVYRGGIKKKLLVVVLIYGIGMICDTIAVFLFIDYTAGEAVTQLVGIVTNIFYCICEILTEKIIKKQGKREQELFSGILLLVPIASVVMLYFLAAANIQNRILLDVEGAGILIINILIFFLYYKISDMYYKLRRQDQIEQQIELYQYQMEIMAQTEKKVRGLRHDIKHHIRQIYVLMKEEKYADILQYLDKMNVNLENPKEYVSSGNKDIDAIVNYMLVKAESEGVTADVKVDIPEGLKIETFTINVILGNLLENAIEAARESDEKKLRISIYTQKGLMYISIFNTYTGEVRKKGDKIFSKKGENHGFGLMNVKEMVESRHGTMRIHYDEAMFQVNVMLYV